MDSCICSEGIRFLAAPSPAASRRDAIAAWRGPPEDGTALTHRLTGHRSRSPNRMRASGNAPRVLSRRTTRSHVVGSVRLLHPRSVAEVGRGRDRVVVTTGDRGWCSNREAAASAEATLCLISLVRSVAQQASVRTTRRSEQSSAPADGALSLSPRRRRPDRGPATACDGRGSPASGDGEALLLRRPRGSDGSTARFGSASAETGVSASALVPRLDFRFRYGWWPSADPST
jgi:hypothetical protein